ncbi:hypothetical protein [Rhodobacter maris]|uniref:Uncharacterized protein n=1 Tax=Rhodobacter maris TaxID=446682 RepID=A0A285S796_9RHOB|nr:hypothetical protein [Rhodobacter maris]SOC03378.1 hypothetical protein SAMN05877831_103347 [Rhodobacter maris]
MMQLAVFFATLFVIMMLAARLNRDDLRLRRPTPRTSNGSELSCGFDGAADCASGDD